MPDTQNYQNHTRWNVFVHFVISPLLAILVIWAFVCVIMEFDWYRVQFFLLAVAALLISLASRTQVLSVQNRIIRLEERLRYKEVLQPDLATRAADLPVRIMIALRFASDEELPDLVQRVLSGELKTSKEIKMAVKNWRADHLRA
ncbi:MAG TPA: DUF6526 family protein [Pyrinomonadaceae bacterium]|mgnify:CR=1 FL=1|nr:DUF6526 family protein [Pyrinomonadaceae bacterium]